MADNTDIRLRRASYRASHRGTKEMDWLLGRFADARLDNMSEAELSAFEELLGAPDPDIHFWIMDAAAIPDDRHAALVQELRAFHQLGSRQRR